MLFSIHGSINNLVCSDICFLKNNAVEYVAFIRFNFLYRCLVFSNTSSSAFTSRHFFVGWYVVFPNPTAFIGKILNSTDYLFANFSVYSF